MKQYVMVLLCLMARQAGAEGPPISADGMITVPYRAVALTELQKKELRFNRVITLSERQAKKEGILHPGRQLFILTSHFNDCTCGLTYGIWFHPDSVAVFGAGYPAFDTLAEGHTMPGRSLRAMAYLQQEEQELSSLYISATGELYYRQQAVKTDTESLYVLFDDLSSKLDSMRKAEPAYDAENPDSFGPLTVTLYIPPMRGNARREKVLQTFYQLHVLKTRHRELEFLFQ